MPANGNRGRDRSDILRYIGMDPTGQLDPDLDFDMVTASLRADAADLRTFMEVLASKLNEALPGCLKVEREGGLFSHSHPVKRLQVELGNTRFVLERSAGGMEGKMVHLVRGVALKTEEASLEHWIDTLSQRLAEHANSSSQARQAISRLLG